MLDHEDLKWIATTSTELNSMLQQISRYSDLARRNQGEYNYIEMLGERVDLASRTAQSLFDHVTSTILENGAARQKPLRRPSPPRFSIVPPPSAAAPNEHSSPLSPVTKPAHIPKAMAAIPLEIGVLNPEGTLELILLVDDETEISDIASQMLTTEGYKVILAKDGFEALKIYGQLGHQIGLVILDFFLPILDGDAVFDELRALNPNVNVVLSSGFAEQSKLGAMLAQGLRGFIPKPYTREKLLEQVRSTLNAARHQMR